MKQKTDVLTCLQPLHCNCGDQISGFTPLHLLLKHPQVSEQATKHYPLNNECAGQKLRYTLSHSYVNHRPPPFAELFQCLSIVFPSSSAKSIKIPLTTLREIHQASFLDLLAKSFLPWNQSMLHFSVMLKKKPSPISYPYLVTLSPAPPFDQTQGKRLVNKR